MTTIVHQVWQCESCKLERIWGNAVLHESYPPNAFLLCDHCKKHTKHVFIRHRFFDVEHKPKLS